MITHEQKRDAEKWVAAKLKQDKKQQPDTLRWAEVVIGAVARTIRSAIARPKDRR